MSKSLNESATAADFDRSDPGAILCDVTASFERSTPQALFDILDFEFGFTLDAAASPVNAKCERYLSTAEDGLEIDWGVSGEVVWLNPPYSRYLISRWMERAWRQSRLGRTVVCLVPASTDTKWFHDWIWNKAVEIRLIKGRVKFNGMDNGAKFPSIVVVYRPPLKIKAQLLNGHVLTRETVLKIQPYTRPLA